MRFTKVESVGNDYVLLDAIAEPALASMDDLAQYAQVLSHRRTGVGADGLLILTRDAEGVLALRVINADGSDGGVCANGLRCAVRLALERGHARVAPRGSLVVRMGGRELVATPKLDAGALRAVSVDMGPPSFDPIDIPIDTAHARHLGGVRWEVGVHELACASMGNPHAVLFDATGAVTTLGPLLEHDPAFPERINVHVAEIIERDRVRMTSWERGSGATYACGTGVCAMVACGVRTGVIDGVCRVEVTGGALLCSWSGEREDGVVLEGPARTVYHGVWGGGWGREGVG